MSSLGKLVSRMGLLLVLSSMPLAAQVTSNLMFKTPFAFYVGNVLMPSGSYIIATGRISIRISIDRRYGWLTSGSHWNHTYRVPAGSR